MFVIFKILFFRYQQWKLLGTRYLDNPDRTNFALYDVIADPGESDDMADENPDIVALMEQKFDVSKYYEGGF